jgi:hypothetical protein
MTGTQTVTLRRELHGFIDAMPAWRLAPLKLLLADLAEPDEPIIIIETDLTEEERQLCIEGEKHFHEHPEDFISLDDFLAHGADYVPPEPEKQNWWPHKEAVGTK